MAQGVPVELSRRAERDLRSLSTTDRRRVGHALTQTLAPDQLPDDADDKSLVDSAPWRRLRVRELRILHRLLPDGTRLVARVIQRGDLERAVRTLPTP